MASPKFPEPPPSMPPSSKDDVDQLLERLANNKHRWAKLGVPERIAHLKSVIDGTLKASARWVEAVCRAKGIHADSHQAGEAWLSDPMPVVRNARLLIEALEQGGQPKPPSLKRRDDGQWVASVFPGNTIDKLMFAGFTGEVWIEPGKEPSQGRIYREKLTEGKLSLVLGAGNIGSIGPMDALYKLFVENELVVLKMNPVNEYIGPFIAEAFQRLVDEGYLGVVYGGAEIGEYLTHHDAVETIHITGSDRTHDAIIWGGSPDEQAKNKAASTPVLSKPITSELGCVTPVFVVPGPWSTKELEFQARHVASMVAHNASFNCNAAKAVLTASGWELREKFLNKLHEELAAIPSRKAYYPGAQGRYDAFLEKYPRAKALGERSTEVVPWTVIPEVAPTADEYALSNEAFCGVLADVTVEARDAAEFMQEAARIANDEIWGTLSCMVLVHPETEKRHAKAFDRFIADLRYGGIAINAWAGVIYGLVTTTWGAFPGHPLDDIRSGRGVVHNTYLFDHPQKSVLRAPFVIKPTPAWFATHKNLKALGEKLTHFEGGPSFLKLPGVVGAALKG